MADTTEAGKAVDKQNDIVTLQSMLYQDGQLLLEVAQSHMALIETMLEVVGKERFEPIYQRHLKAFKESEEGKAADSRLATLREELKRHGVEVSAKQL